MFLLKKKKFKYTFQAQIHSFFFFPISIFLLYSRKLFKITNYRGTNEKVSIKTEKVIIIY